MLPRPSTTTWLSHLYRGLYSALFSLLLPFFFLSWLARLALGKQTVEWRRIQRFALSLPRNIQSNSTLVHCVSVGEVTAASPLIKAIMQQHPAHSIVVSTTTTSGAAHVKQLFSDTVQHCYLPYDVPLLMRWFIHKIQPQQVLITEVELWPNLINLCWHKKIPVSVINARMTERSAKQYQRLSGLFTPMLHQLKLVCVQGERDFNNYRKLGIDRNKLHNTGNLKFDVNTQIPPLCHPCIDPSILTKRFILIAGSTHEPEERLILDATQKLTESIPNLLLILVPRHPQRFDEVFNLCQQSQLQTTRLSSQSKLTLTTPVLLVDSMGVLQQLYAIANMAFIGGSIAQRGGHNPLEAAACGVPVLMGPSRFNNPEICQTLSTVGALVTVLDEQDIVSKALHWHSHMQERQAAGHAGKQVVNDNAGATSKTLALLFK